MKFLCNFPVCPLLSKKHIPQIANDIYSAFFLMSTPTAYDTSVVIDVALNMKARNAETALERNSWLLIERDSTVTRLAGEYRNTRHLLSKQFVGNFPSVKKSLIDSLTARCDLLESELSRHRKYYGDRDPSRTITVDHIAAAIPPGCTLVEYVKWASIEPNETTVKHRYMALVIDNTSRKTVLDLGEAANIEGAVAQYRADFLSLSNLKRPMSQRKQSIYNTISRKLYDAVWKL